MTESEVLNLLNRRESEALDFKRDPYRVVEASDADKAKLVKDVLAFANAWRDGPAVILIGVDEDGPAGPAVVGIPADDPFDDATLQQLVHGKLNRPLPLSYERVTVGGLVVGVIEVAHTVDRPYFLAKPFGGVPADTVFTRRGSTNAQARPDEIARMGETHARGRHPKLTLEFADQRAGRIIGPRATLRVARLHLPAKGTPEWAAIAQRESSEREFSFLSPRPKAIADVFAEMRDKLAWGWMAFAVTNNGTGPATDVQASFHLPRRHAFTVVECPPLPLGEMLSSREGGRTSVEIAHTREQSVVVLRAPKIHAGGRALIRCGLVVHAAEAAEHAIRARLFADELPAPQSSELVLRVEVDDREFQYRP